VGNAGLGVKRRVILTGPLQRKTAAEYLRGAPDGWVMTLQPESRSTAENALLHVLIRHIAKRSEWAGKRHEGETWKRLLTAAWCRARGEPIELLPALDGNGVDIVFRRTSSLSRGECAELIEYVYAWGAQNGVQFPPDPREVAQ